MKECEALSGLLRDICRGEAGFDLLTTNKFRESLGLPPLAILSEPVSTPSVAIVHELPPLLERVGMFAAALAKHACDGFRRRSEEEIREILDTHCRSCEFFSGQHCTRCGCYCNDHDVFLNKLAWKSESCPENKW
jgi:hypothetical protein